MRRNTQRKWSPPAKVMEFLKSERQWRRSVRIVSAQYELSKATDNSQKRFWEDVLRALGAKVPARVSKKPAKPQKARRTPKQSPAALPLAA